MNRHVVFIGFSTTGKSTIAKRCKEELDFEIEIIDTDHEISKQFGGSISNIFYTIGRDKALIKIKELEKKLIEELTLSDKKNLLIAAGPAFPTHQEFAKYIKIQNPIVALFEKTTEEAYCGLIDRRVRMLENPDHHNPNFGIWDIGVTTKFEEKRIVLDSKKNALRNISKIITQNNEHYYRYAPKIFNAAHILKQNRLPQEIKFLFE